MSDQSPDPAAEEAARAAAADGAAVVAVVNQAQTQPEPDVTDPAKLIRLGTMLQAVLGELRESETDAAGLERLAAIHTETVEELQTILSDDLQDELMEFNNCCTNDTPTESEMRVAHAQLVGWIQGLLRGMQATATAQAQLMQQQMMMMQAQAQQRALMGQGVPGGAAPAGQQPPQAADGPSGPDSGYL